MQKMMNASFDLLTEENLKSGIGPCLTFEEVIEFLNPFLIEGDLTYFLQEHGYADDDGQPCEDDFNKTLFKVVKPQKKDSTDASEKKTFFMTEEGLKKFFEIGLTKYLLERPVQIGL